MEVTLTLTPQDGLEGMLVNESLEVGLQKVRERCGQIVKGNYKMEAYYGFILTEDS